MTEGYVYKDMRAMCMGKHHDMIVFHPYIMTTSKVFCFMFFIHMAARRVGEDSTTTDPWSMYEERMKLKIYK